MLDIERLKYIKPDPPSFAGRALYDGLQSFCFGMEGSIPSVTQSATTNPAITVTNNHNMVYSSQHSLFGTIVNGKRHLLP